MQPEQYSLALVDTLPDSQQGLTFDVEPSCNRALSALPSYDPAKEDAQDPNMFLRTKTGEGPEVSLQGPLQALPAPPEELPVNRKLFEDASDDEMDGAFFGALSDAYEIHDPDDELLSTIAVLQAAYESDEDDWDGLQDCYRAAYSRKPN